MAPDPVRRPFTIYNKPETMHKFRAGNSSVSLVPMSPPEAEGAIDVHCCYFFCQRLLLLLTSDRYRHCYMGLCEDCNINATVIHPGRTSLLGGGGAGLQTDL